MLLSQSWNSWTHTLIVMPSDLARLKLPVWSAHRRSPVILLNTPPQVWIVTSLKPTLVASSSTPGSMSSVVPGQSSPRLELSRGRYCGMLNEIER